ncbi:MAG: glycosyltransferase family 2 protein [bacterium]|nr:glycosyltransferase family 2 protein [bacterium]
MQIKRRAIKDIKISIVIPSYNEEKNVQVLANKLVDILKDYYDYEIIFIDDGSTDNTLSELKDLNKRDNKIHYISFSKNFGHQNALRAGLDCITGDCAISMDADLQHPAELIPQMIDKWAEGYNIVYTIRKENKKDSFFKRKTANIFYGIMNYMSGLRLEKGSADFRLMDKSVVKVLRNFKEMNIFYRGIASWLGFKQYGISYFPNERLHGETKYTLRKMALLAFNGITSFSILPLQISTVLGATISFLAFSYGIYAIIIKIVANKAISGWASVMVGIFFLGGIQLLMLGIIGNYIGKLFLEAKRRPNYIIEETSLS